MSDTSIGLSSTSVTSPSQASDLSLVFSPSVDWFVARWVSVGVEIDLSYDDSKGYGAGAALTETKSSSYGGAVRLGVVIPLGDRVSIWPRVAGGVGSTHTVQTVEGGAASTLGTSLGLATTTYSGPWASVYVPLLIHGTRRFFIGAGPSIYHLFARANANPDLGGEQTTIGGRFTIGTALGGEQSESDAEREPEKRARFGSAGQYVLAGSFGSAYATTYEGTSTKQSNVVLTPSVDYFIVDHFSFGAAVSFSYFHIESPAPSTTANTPPVTIQNDLTSFYLSPRLGMNLALGDSFSFYPVTSLSFGTRHHDIRSPSDENKIDETVISFGLYAPLLFHAAEHVFLGFGPYVSHDLSRKDENSPDEILLTTVGASFIAGGWL
jgi:hypothetical protein